MSKGVNKVILVGNLGNDPDCKYTQAGMCITKISLATTSSRKNKDGERVDRTEWHRVVLLGKLGEIAGEYLRKGGSVYIEGSLRYDKYTDKDGVERYTTDIVADQMQMLSARQTDGGYGTAQQRQGTDTRQPRGGSNAGRAASSASPPMDDFADDDIPF